MRIGLDYDSVITDSRRQKAALAMQRHGVDVPWRMFKWYTVVPGGYLTSDEVTAIGREVHFSDEHNRHTPEVQGSIDGIRRLLGEGHDVQIVTGRDGDAAKYANRWLLERGIQLPLMGVGSGNSKRDAANGLDVFVDDDLDKLVDLDVRHRFIFTWDYNMHVHVPDGIKRVYSWPDLRRKINDIQTEGA